MTKTLEYKGYIIKASTKKYEVFRDGKLVLLNGKYQEVDEGKHDFAAYGRCQTIKDGILHGKLIVDTILGNIPKKATLRKRISNLYKLKRKRDGIEYYRHKLEQFIARYPDFDISIYPEVFEMGIHWRDEPCE